MIVIVVCMLNGPASALFYFMRHITRKTEGFGSSKTYIVSAQFGIFSVALRQKVTPLCTRSVQDLSLMSTTSPLACSL